MANRYVVRLGRMGLLVIDDVSRQLDEAVLERTKSLLSGMVESQKKLLPSIPAFKDFSEAEIAEMAEHEVDMPFFEGHSGLASFLAQGTQKKAREFLAETYLDKETVDNLVNEMNVWFIGEQNISLYAEMPGHLQPLIMAMATRWFAPLSQPAVTLYRELDAKLQIAVGDTYKVDEPKSWSEWEKPLTGNTTLIAKTHHGTRVSVLSPYPGEMEVISMAPDGYVVTAVEDRTYMGRKTRRVVNLEDR